MYVQVIVDKVQSSNVSSVDQWFFNCDTAILCYNYWIIKLPYSFKQHRMLQWLCKHAIVCDVSYKGLK